MTGPSLFDFNATPTTEVSVASADDGSSAPVIDLAPGRTQSLYRKYRPQTFGDTDLVGQEHVVQTLRNAIAMGRVAHAYLFCGPRGTGKTTTARLLAKAANCSDPDPKSRPCNVCSNCVAITTGATTDVIEIDAASNRGIDDIRDLRERVKYAPTQLQTKFYIIDEAHQITGAAANAFLKTLEEPPGHTKFVLATTDPDDLLPTIVSRCQRFDFRRIGLETAVGRLRTVAEDEGIAVDDAALSAVARAATGSLRDALGLLDQLAVYQEGDDEADVAERVITTEAVHALLGISRNDRVERLVVAMADRDAGLALGEVNAAVEAGEDPRQLNRQLVAYLRQLLHARAGGAPEADKTARELAMRFDLLELAQIARRFGENDYKIRHATFPQLPLEIALVECVLRGTEATPAQSSMATEPTPRPIRKSEDTVGADTTSDPPSTPRAVSLKARVRNPSMRLGESPSSARERPNDAPVPQPADPSPSGEPRPNGNVVPIRPPAAPEPPSAAPIATSGGASLERVVDLWETIRQDVKAVNRRIEALLASVDPVHVTDSEVVLASAYEFHRSRLASDDARIIVEEAISRRLGRTIRVETVLRSDAGAYAVATTVEVPSTDVANTPPRSANGAKSSADAPATESLREAATDPDAHLDQERADDARRLKAAKNIFDAEEIKDEV